MCAEVPAAAFKHRTQIIETRVITKNTAKKGENEVFSL